MIRALELGHKGKCAMICTAIINGLTDAEVLDHIAIQNLRSTRGSVRTLRRYLRKADHAVLSNAEVIAARQRRAS